MCGLRSNRVRTSHVRAGIAVASACAWIAAAPSTAPPNPFTLDAATPSPSPIALPEIGRVRSTGIACVAMRDLVIPSFAAARRNDTEYADATQRLKRYISASDDDSNKQAPAYLEGLLSKLDMNVSALRTSLLVINRALGDPRISADAVRGNPQLSDLRAQLQRIYAVQADRTNALGEFVMREQAAMNRAEFSAGSTAFSGRGTRTPATESIPAAAPTRQPIGMPVRSGIEFGDIVSIADWTGSYVRQVRQTENGAAKVFFPIAQSCR